MNTLQNDSDPIETQEWLEALEDIIEQDGKARAHFLLETLTQKTGIALNHITTPYINSISDTSQHYPGDLALENNITNIIRWNAVMMVSRGVKKSPELGGHLSTYASAAYLYEVGFHHFFKKQDLLYIQGHASPGIYARAFLEGRLSETQLSHFRQEVNGQGLSSYPHPWLMPAFWQFPTVSMGLGPLQAIYQARFLKYLHHRGLADTANRKVWVFLGDGETDEVESLGALSLATREKLDNLIFVVNCNLQRLDGPVRGNGKIIQELESSFSGAGWAVIKVIWGSNWDEILRNDTQHVLKKRMMETVDGDYQNYHTKDGAYFREHFFNSPELKKLVQHLTDEALSNLTRGGLDPVKVYQAYTQAVHQDKPVVILAKTVKGYGMGVQYGEGMNIAHNLKKLSSEALKTLRDKLHIPLDDTQVEKLSFYYPGDNSPEILYLKKQRELLGGYLPARRTVSSFELTLPPETAFLPLFDSTGTREISTTMAFVKIINHLMKHESIGKHIVPIIPDESRTFGMEGMFRQYGIYSPHGQQYTPADKEQVMYYKEAKDGQLLEEGINEAGAFCSWIAAGTAYSVTDTPMIPFYIYYSMFGFQRIGDLAWAAADSRTKGFLIGGTAGRTTLAGEGLQHQDGHHLLLAATIPNCIAYDPTYAYEMAVIIQHGLERMFKNNESVFYYITAMNENYTHPSLPAVPDIKQGIIRGMYLCRKGQLTSFEHQAVLLGSGAILREVLAAADILETEYCINTSVFSATSFNELRREALDVERQNLLHPEHTPQKSYVRQLLEQYHCPVIATTDYMRSYADQIRGFIPKTSSYTVLGTDGFGRSDTREQLRHFFEIDKQYIVIATLKALADEQKIPLKTVSVAINKYNIDPDKLNPVRL